MLKKCDSWIYKMTRYLLLAICSYCICIYIQFERVDLAGTVLFILFVGLQYVVREDRIKKDERKLFAIPAVVFAALLVLGYHIHIEDRYMGLVDKNYITPYGGYDLAAFFILLYGIYYFMSLMYLIMKKILKKIQVVMSDDSSSSLDIKKLIIYTGILVVLWLPYLIIYFPGFVFSDTLSSIYQAMDLAPLNNHHPVLYTMFIRLCFKLGNIIGDNTTGCAIYCVLQMFYMAYGISYMACWIETKFKVNQAIGIIIVIVYGFSSYIGQLSIAMWKDPIFSVTVMLLSIVIYDILMQGKPLKYFAAFGLILLMEFSRNNGVYIAISLLMADFVIILIVKNRKKAMVNIFIICFIAILIELLVTGVIYEKMDIGQEKVEAYGVFLNQMARVVVYNGDLSEDNLLYMNELMPLELYESVYTPCCVDNLKWSPDFNADALDNEFWRQYFSVLAKNPKLCFEAWVMQTHGFWLVNSKWVNDYNGNILSGVPRNYYTDTGDAKSLGIDIVEYKDSWYTSFFPIEAYDIPISVATWFLFITVIGGIIKKKMGIIISFSTFCGINYDFGNSVTN